jgi:hypothetical protein
LVEGFGLDQFGGEVGTVKRSRQSLLIKNSIASRSSMRERQSLIEIRLIERMSMKKAKATHRVALRSFGLDQFGRKVGEKKFS